MHRYNGIWDPEWSENTRMNHTCVYLIRNVLNDQVVYVVFIVLTYHISLSIYFLCFCTKCSQ